MSKKGRPRKDTNPATPPTEPQELTSKGRVQDTNSERQKNTRHKKVTADKWNQ